MKTLTLDSSKFTSVFQTFTINVYVHGLDAKANVLLENTVTATILFENYAPPSGEMQLE